MAPIPTDKVDPAHDCRSRGPLYDAMAVPIAGRLAFATVLTLGLVPVLRTIQVRVSSPS